MQVCVKCTSLLYDVVNCCSLWLFLPVTWVCLQFVIVVFSGHTHLLFLNALGSSDRG